MGLFNKKSTLEQFGTALRGAYVDMCKDWYTSLTGTPNGELKWPQDLMNEIGALDYFAIELGVSSSTDRSRADRIIGAFLEASPPPSHIASLFTERCSQYANAIRSADQERGSQRLGEIFAEHCGHKGDPLVFALASTHFMNTLAFIAEQTKQAIQTMN